MTITDQIRSECARVAAGARQVRIEHHRIGPYAAALADLRVSSGGGMLATADREASAAYWLTLDAINFGSGWFPTLRKRTEPTGYRTIAAGLKRRFDRHGPWSAAELRAIEPAELATVFDQEPGHELIGLFARSLRDLGTHLQSFAGVVDDAGGSAVALVQTLADWPCFADSSDYDRRPVPFLKRAQIAAADLHRAGVVAFADLDALTMFADNLVPHVLRLDGLLRFEPDLVAAIERGELLEHGSEPEVEIRACALHAVELLVAAAPGPTSAAAIDEHLWQRGQQPAYKARPRHRSRTTAY